MSSFTIGLARVDVTPEVHGVGMLGWGMPGNVVRGVAMRLHARAFVLEDPGGACLALVSLEICYITTLLRQSVLRRLQEQHPELPFDDATLLLTTTHTHSAPGGYSHARFDNASVPGLQPEVLERLVAGTVQAVAEAWAGRAPGRLRLVAGDIPPELPVAFNRALRAHHKNPEVTRRFGPDERHLAIDRTMTLVRVEDLEGRPRGLLNWFGVHCTSVHSDNTLIHGDNKGYACLFTEEALRAQGCPDAVALFLQGATGDVTPNHRMWPGRKLPGGTSPDDDQSARDNGRIQADQALLLFERARTSPELHGPLSVAIEHRDMGTVAIDADLAAGLPTPTTAPGAVGARMLRGTWEGPGTPLPIGLGLQLLTRAWQLWARLTPFLRTSAQRRWLAVHGPKAPLLAVGFGTVLSQGWSVLFIPPRFDPIVDHLAQQQRAVGTEPWLPQILPLHLIRLGELGIIGMPAEPTTQACRRIQATAAAAMGVRVAMMTGYCNDYSGYVTTPEEYERQGYEGSFTQFGQGTLPAWQSRIRALARHLDAPKTALGQPLTLPQDVSPRRHGVRGWLSDGAPAPMPASR